MHALCEQNDVVAAATKYLAMHNYTLQATGSMSFRSDTGFGANVSAPVGLWQFPGTTGAGFPMGSQQVAVWVGCTPPASSYFSFSHTVMTKQPGFHVVWANPVDSINMLVANSSHNAELNANSTTAIVLSADATSASTAVEALDWAGLGSNAVNVLVIPSSLVGNMGESLDASLMQVRR